MLSPKLDVMTSSEVPRVSAIDLPVQRFLTEYVLQNRPVVVTGALGSWDIEHTWTPAALEGRFGEQRVQVYNNYFDLQTLMPLKRFLSQYFCKPEYDPAHYIPYVRWYTQLRDLKFCWADDVFRGLQSQWSLPAFLPETDYVLPLAVGVANPVTDPFPAKGLFISPRGARTSLHVDPWGSCAVLCQLYGQKRWYFYAPDQARYVRNGAAVVDVTRPDRKEFPAFERAQLSAACTLKPSEVIYIPHGWYHQVECDSDSVSLTWNFVHRTTAASLISWLKEAPHSEFDQSVLRFFYALPPGDDVAARALDVIREKSN
jgi:hypothetical protein